MQMKHSINNMFVLLKDNDTNSSLPKKKSHWWKRIKLLSNFPKKKSVMSLHIVHGPATCFVIDLGPGSWNGSHINTLFHTFQNKKTKEGNKLRDAGTAYKYYNNQWQIGKQSVIVYSQSWTFYKQFQATTLQTSQILSKLLWFGKIQIWVSTKTSTILTDVLHSFPQSLQVKKTPWSGSASELYRPSDRHLSAKWLPTFADRGCHVVNSRIIPWSKSCPNVE
jgi:hypothetical protein